MCNNNYNTNILTTRRKVMNPKEYNFKEYETDTVENAVIKYGKGNIYTAVFNMEAKIASLQVEVDSLREMIDWDNLHLDDISEHLDKTTNKEEK